MEEEDIISIKNIFYDFKEKISKDINNNSISMDNEDCYLIEESWSNELVECLNRYHDYKNKNKIKKNQNLEEYLPQNEPKFIKNFSDIIKCLKSNKNMIIVTRELMLSIYEEDGLKICNIIKYYSGNKKIIIKFDNDNNKALLLINPDNIIQNNNNIFIISIKKDKTKEENICFQEILSQEN